jgi:hypothetical protein
LCEKWRGMCLWCVSVVRLIVATRNSGPNMLGLVASGTPCTIMSNCLKLTTEDFWQTTHSTKSLSLFTVASLWKWEQPIQKPAITHKIHIYCNTIWGDHVWTVTAGSHKCQQRFNHQMYCYSKSETYHERWEARIAQWPVNWLCGPDNLTSIPASIGIFLWDLRFSHWHLQRFTSCGISHQVKWYTANDTSRWAISLHIQGLNSIWLSINVASYNRNSSSTVTFLYCNKLRLALETTSTLPPTKCWKYKITANSWQLTLHSCKVEKVWSFMSTISSSLYRAFHNVLRDYENSL